MFSGLLNIVQNENLSAMPESIIRFLSEKTSSNATLIDLNMRLIAHSCYNNSSIPQEQMFYTDLKNEYVGSNRVALPLITQGEQNAALTLYKEDIFTEEELLLIKTAALTLSVAVYHNLHIYENNKALKTSAVKSAISTLSYSELEAVLAIFEDFVGCEALIVASKIAGEKKITRSIIVNALRKMESAGIIESRSLGMKGTYIKILNTQLIDELKKFKS